MKTTSRKDYIPELYSELFYVSASISDLLEILLEKFNTKELTLSDLRPHERIFLFFLTRTMKTFNALHKLCFHGYGQDAATLLRNILENLISERYIDHDDSTADSKATRFVEYKWVILKRYVGSNIVKEDEMTPDIKVISGDLKQLILKKFKSFKEKYSITSDRGLLTWSGKSVRDMAKLCGAGLLDEYEYVFRYCSRFSHPSVIGDREYLNQEDGNIMFLPGTSASGIALNLSRSMGYMLDFLVTADRMFSIGMKKEILDTRDAYEKVLQMKKYRDDIHADKPIYGENKKATGDLSIKFDI